MSLFLDQQTDEHVAIRNYKFKLLESSYWKARRETVYAIVDINPD